MRVSLGWLRELVDYKLSSQELAELLPLRTIGIKDVTEGYIELDMKGYNRSDLLSMRGVALEVAAITGSKIRFDDSIPELPKGLPEIGIEADDKKLCPFYSLVKIEDLKVGPSSEEWVRKLEESGMRSVNNIADVTNLVMLEFGQPLHSFDADTVSGETVIVRTAHQGEKIETLDSKARGLETSDLLIADKEKALGIAGIMGGKNSEITDSTKSILLEAAIFDPQNLRATSQRLGLISEASKRFYHGLTRERLFQALKRAIELYEGMGGKVTAFSFEDNLISEQTEIILSKAKANSLIGVEIGGSEIEEYLSKLNISLEKISEEEWRVTPPFYRLDIKIEEDVIEEIARMYGYERIPARELKGELPERINQDSFEAAFNVKVALSDIGLTEVQTYSFYSTEVLKNLGFYPDGLNALVKIANPISTETEYMRTMIWPNLLEVVAKNYKQGFEDIAVFEAGKMYGIENGEIKEGYNLGIALMNGTDNPAEELYGIIKEMLEKLNLKLDLGDTGREEIENRLFHPTRFQHLLINKREAGGLSEVHPRIVNKFGLDKRVAVAEIPLKVLL